MHARAMKLGPGGEALGRLTLTRRDAAENLLSTSRPRAAPERSLILGLSGGFMSCGTEREDLGMVGAVEFVGWRSGAAQVAKCLFCGAIGPWWDCFCGLAGKIRDGKLPRPRTVIRGGVPVIECCAELREAARMAWVIRVSDETDKVPDETDSGENETDKAGETDNACVICAKRFTAGRSDARYCSAACRLKAHRGKE